MYFILLVFCVFGCVNCMTPIYTDDSLDDVLPKSDLSNPDLFNPDLFNEDWFSGFKKRDTGLLLCKKNVDGLLFKIPKLPDCQLPDLKQNSTPIVITTYWPNDGEDPVVAKECFSESYDNIVTPTVGGLKRPYLLRQNQKFERLSKEVCSKMILRLKSPNDEELSIVSHGVRGTNNHKVPEPRWFQSPKVKNVNFYIVDIKMAIDQESKVVKPIGTSTTKSCTIEEEECPTYRGLLIWNKENHKKCHVKIGRTTPCLRTGNHITCKETYNYIIGWQTTEICGVKVAKATSGLLFSSNSSGELHPDIKSHQEILSKIQDDLPSRFKFEAYADMGVVSTTQFASWWEHIVSTVEEKINSAIVSFHTADCRSNKMQLLMHVQDAAQGNVVGLIHGLTGDPTYRYNKIIIMHT